jgi:F-box/TPR repeat protein Pof3
MALSRDSGLIDAAALLQQNGQKLYQQGNFQAALEVFTEVILTLRGTISVESYTNNVN